MFTLDLLRKEYSARNRGQTTDEKRSLLAVNEHRSPSLTTSSCARRHFAEGLLSRFRTTTGLVAYLIISSSLSGCSITTAFLAGSIVTSAWITEPRRLQTIKRDAIINYQVNQKLARDRNIAQQAHIVATSYNRVVLLTGQVPHDELSQRAAQYAYSTPQVKRVFNQLTQTPLSNPWQRSRDTAITATVRTRLLATKGLHSHHFKIVTENNTVFILGVASPEQAAVATAVVQHTSGVKRVVKLIEIMSV